VPNVRRSRDVRRQADVIDWRRQYLAQAGVDADLARVVAADLRWDLHALLQLLDRGCPPDLAARILEPADGEEVER
jgi:hypothetical protein